MTDLRSSNIYDTLDEDAPVVSTKKDTKPAASEKPSSKKVDAPAKKEKPTKSEDPAAPIGKDQRGGGGRESKPRGRGRDNKGGLRRPQGDRPVREFDRRSGPSATHRNPKEGKRHDRGSHNWGDPVEEGTIAAQPVEEAIPVSPPPAAEENKTEVATENKEEQKEQKQEEVDNTVTYDQYLKIKDSKAPENDKLEARAVEIEEGRWKVATTLVSEKKSKKKSDDSEEDKEDDKTEKSSKKKKNIVTWDQFVASAPKSAPREARPPREASERGGRGGTAGAGAGVVAGGAGATGAGTGGARGGGRGARGGRGGARGGGGRGRGAPLIMSEDAFPKLGK